MLDTIFLFLFQLQWIIVLHLCLTSVSYSFTPTISISSLRTSMNLLFGVPLCLLPGGSILSVPLPKYSLSFLCTYPNFLSLFLNLSILVTPKENLDIFNFAHPALPSGIFQTYIHLYMKECMKSSTRISWTILFISLSLYIYIVYTLLNFLLVWKI